MAKLFYFCHLKKLIRPETFWTLLRIYLKSVLRYKFLMLDSYHPDTVYLREQGCEVRCLFLEAKKGSAREGNENQCCGPRFLQLLYEPHYWYANPSLLVSGLNKK